MTADILSATRAYLPAGDLLLIEHAAVFARQAHAGQMRVSGDPYVTHTEAVANLLADLRLDAPTVAAGLLHDVLEDTAVGRDALAAEFGEEVVSMVEGVTAIDSCRMPTLEDAQAENWRKMLLAVTRDIRVILIKFADRIHNLRTIEHLPEDRQRRMAAESLSLYAPFAQRLGVYRWKSEIEDLSFAVLQPRVFHELRAAWELRAEGNERLIEEWRRTIHERLESSGIPFRLSARPKNLYGIHKKMQRQQKEFSEIQDLAGMRLITDTVASCYALLSMVQTHFKPVEGSFTDYISVPKINMYQSLHITVTDTRGRMAEFQIRTEDMHRRAEYGIAAHWRYKESGFSQMPGRDGREDIEEKLDWLKQVLEWQQEFKDAREFLTAFRDECRFVQIYVYTPKGRVVKLPESATPVDFAYQVHSEIGNHCVGAKVGGRIVPLDSHLKSSDVCEILTRRNSRPNKHWLEFVVTPQARSKIRKYYRDQGEEIK